MNSFDAKDELLYFLLFLIWVVPAAIWHGFVFAKLWLWILVPIFLVEPLSVTQCVALSVMIGFLSHRQKREKYPTIAERLGNDLSDCFVAPLIALGIGKLVSMFL